MKSIAIAAALAVSALAAPAFAADPTPAPAAAAPDAKLSVENSTIEQIIANPAAKAALEKELPQIPAYYDQIKTMTLSQVAPMSQGAIDAPLGSCQRS
ncbi:MAG: hypothetical protein JF588_15165 [Caulobacterales bacterium]|nr:hypothetical protein [Caulobacterales bacterium]